MALSERDRKLIFIIAGVVGALILAFILFSLASVPGAATDVSPPPSVAFVAPQTISPAPINTALPPPPAAVIRDPFVVPCSLSGPSPAPGSTCTPAAPPPSST
jgi:hypothetical protein